MTESKSKIEIYDDFLEEKDHKLIYDYFMGNMDKGDIENSMCWTWLDGISQKGDGHFQLVHQVFFNNTPISPAWQLMKPIIDKEEVIGLARIKANCLVKTEKEIIFDWAFHTDFHDLGDEAITAIYYVNSNNGKTIFEDGKYVESVANRFVRFPHYMKHTGSTCTDEDRRVIINFNYYVPKYNHIDGI